MFIYGILSVLYVMESYIVEEKYEECKKIIDAIKEQEQRLDIKLFTVINEDTMSAIVKTYNNFNLTGENVICNSRYYAEIIIDEIDLKYS